MLSILKKFNEENEKMKFDCQLFFEEWPDGLLISDIKTKHFIMGNKAICKMLGYTKEEIQTLGVKDIHPSADLPHILSQFEDLLKEKITLATNLPVQKKDGGIFYVDIAASPVIVSGKNYIMGNFRDITERIQKEKVFKTLFEHSQDAIMTLEPPIWAFTSGNSATLKLFGIKDEKEFIKTSPWVLSPEYQSDGQLSKVKAQEMITKAMKDGSNFFEWTHKKYKGADFFATVLLSRVTLGSKTFIQATVRDITQQKINEKLLQDKIEELSRVNKLMIGRELKMAELKQEMERLKNQLK